MLANFQFLLFASTLLLVIFWLIDKQFARLRTAVLVGGSVVILSVISVESLIFAVVILFQGILMLKLQARYAFSRSIGFCALIFVPLCVQSSWQSIAGFPIATLGLSYYSLKLYSLLRDSVMNEQSPTVQNVLFYIFFYPVFSLGPIENFRTLNQGALENEFDANELLYGIYRVLLGVIKVAYIADQLIRPIVQHYSLDQMDASIAWIWTIISFAYVYINFSGFSDIAIGLSRCFGVRIRENFNHPYLARNIQAFWQRWHMSLGAWVSQYLFFPMLRSNGKPFISLLVVFLLMGLWHHFTLNYVVWGLMHGLAMGTTRHFARSVSTNKHYVWIRDTRVYGLASCVITMLYVSVISKFANLPSFEEGVTYLKVLI